MLAVRLRRGHVLSRRYVDYALDVPMYFVKRGDHYVDVTGASFRDLMAGRLAQLPGERAVRSDWVNHLSTIFPEVRLKKYLEMRGADAGPWRRLPALPALWVGVLYDNAALDAAWDLVKHWTTEQRQQLRDEVPRLGFDAMVAGRSARDVAADMLALARSGLARRGRFDYAGRDETKYLEAIDRFVESGKTAAEELLERFAGKWGGSVDPVFEDYAY